MKAIMLAKDEINDIITLYQSGSSLKNIGKLTRHSKPFIKKILQSHSIIIKIPKRISKQRIDLFIDIFKKTGSLEKARSSASIGKGTALKIIKEYNLHNEKKCIYCGSSKLYTMKNNHIYPCCVDCKDKHFNDINKTRVKSVQEKYGVANIAMLESTKEKFKKTCIKKYGVKNPLQNKEIKEKAENTLNKNYGVIVPCKNKEINNRMKQTNLKKYGVENVLQNKEIKEKAENTMIANYGVKNGFQSEEIKGIIKENLVEKYGVEHSAQIPEVKYRMRKTFLDKYGVSSAQQIPEAKIKARKTLRDGYWETFKEVLSNKYIEPLFDKEKYIESSLGQTNQFKCLRCNAIIDSSKINPHQICCKCSTHRSYYEDDIISWLRSIGIDNIKPNEKYYENGKLKFEIDIYLPEYNLGIDFNGIYWHCDRYRNRSYHQNKYKYFNTLGIHLIQVFENEWINKEDIVKSIIKNKLGKSNTIYARKCIIKDIPLNEYSKFLRDNHMQGTVRAAIKLGLYYDNELVCAGSFGKFRYKNEDAYELLRFASKKEHNIVGGFNKILKHFEIEYAPKKLISFIDVRYFKGNSYNDFNIELLTAPNYFYFKEKDKSLTLWSRVKFQKHKLNKILDCFDPKLSEYENMINNGYLRIFDAGNLKMVKKYN